MYHLETIKILISTIYLHKTIERIRNSMSTGKVCVLLKLDRLYDSLYSVLNQRYINAEGQRFCSISLGQEKISCIIHKNFRTIVVMSKEEAHHICKDKDHYNIHHQCKSKHAPVAFLSRFEKHYLDPKILDLSK